jgi:hypothetical protein
MKSAALALVLAAGCATDGSEEPTTGPKQHMPAGSTFTLYVSNQSLDRGLVDMQVSIDGQLAVSGDFSVFSGGAECGGLPQHNWYEFKLAVPAGAHQITVISNDVVETFQTSFSINPDHFGVLAYWYDATTDEPAHFGWDAMATQPGFE